MIDSDVRVTLDDAATVVELIVASECCDWVTGWEPAGRPPELVIKEGKAMTFQTADGEFDLTGQAMAEVIADYLRDPACSDYKITVGGKLKLDAADVDDETLEMLMRKLFRRVYESY